MDNKTYKRKTEELKMLIKIWCDGVGCSGCIYEEYDDNGNKISKCRATELNNEILSEDAMQHYYQRIVYDFVGINSPKQWIKHLLK